MCDSDNEFQLNFFAPEVKQSVAESLLPHGMIYTQDITVTSRPVIQFSPPPTKTFTTRGLYRFFKKSQDYSPESKGLKQICGFKESLQYVDSEFQKISKTAKKFTLNWESNTILNENSIYFAGPVNIWMKSVFVKSL